MKMSLAYKGKETKEEEKAEGASMRKSKEKEKDNRRNLTYQVRKISNGYIKKTSWEEGEGDKYKYHDEEEYHDHDPFEAE